jgi:hypothetical protein
MKIEKNETLIKRSEEMPPVRDVDLNRNRMEN